MEKNDNLISMVLHLVRNLLAIQDKPSSSYQTTESVEQASLQVRRIFPTTPFDRT